jgi:hypothetical protein
LNDEDGPAARTTRPPPSRRDDQALEALSAMYVPRWRIGFLVPPAARAADRAVLISEFAEKINMKARGCVITLWNEIHRSTKLLARGSKMDLNCGSEGRNEHTFWSHG